MWKTKQMLWGKEVSYCRVFTTDSETLECIKCFIVLMCLNYTHSYGVYKKGHIIVNVNVFFFQMMIMMGIIGVIVVGIIFCK